MRKSLSLTAFFVADTLSCCTRVNRGATGRFGDRKSQSTCTFIATRLVRGVFSIRNRCSAATNRSRIHILSQLARGPMTGHFV